MGQTTTPEGNEIKLVIGGIDYIVRSDDDPAYIHMLADELTHRLAAVSASHQYLSTVMVAVLTALQYLDESKKAEADAVHLRAQMKEYIEDAAGARLETEEARREIDRLNRENRKLRGN